MSANQKQVNKQNDGFLEALCYVETSALLWALLERDGDTFAILYRSGPRVTSALTFAEAYRAVLRARIDARITLSEERSIVKSLQTFEQRCTVIDITPSVLQRSTLAFAVEPLRTPDAIHLATAELVAGHPSSMEILTRDRRIAENARAMGYAVL